MRLRYPSFYEISIWLRYSPFMKFISDSDIPHFTKFIYNSDISHFKKIIYDWDIPHLTKFIYDSSILHFIKFHRLLRYPSLCKIYMIKKSLTFAKFIYDWDSRNLRNSYISITLRNSYIIQISFTLPIFHSVLRHLVFVGDEFILIFFTRREFKRIISFVLSQL